MTKTGANRFQLAEDESGWLVVDTQKMVAYDFLTERAAKRALKVFSQDEVPERYYLSAPLTDFNIKGKIKW